MNVTNKQAIQMAIPSVLGYEKLAMDFVATFAEQIPFSNDKTNMLLKPIKNNNLR